MRRRLTLAFLLTLASLVVGTGCTRRGETPDAPGGGADSPGGGFDAALDAPLASGCIPGAEWVYLLDHDRRFLRFEPPSTTLTVLGTLDCAAGDASPFSMGIGRDGYARVLYNDGSLHRVSIGDLSCSPLSFAMGQEGFELFGMGYSADAFGAPEETLFVGGGQVITTGFDAPMALGNIDPALRLTRIGGLSSLPELTGTAHGGLWGFFPGESPMRVIELEKSSGASVQTFDVSVVGDGGSTLSYAFAHWGGRFYIFFMSEAAPSSAIWVLTPDLGQVDLVLENSGYRIVGAGVSTCAPADLI